MIGKIPVLFGVLLLLPTLARASSINVQTFTPSSGYEYVYSEDALMDTRQGWGLGVTYDYLSDPLIRTNLDSTEETVKVLTALHTLDLAVTYRLSPRILLGLGLPLELVTFADPNSTKSALGDSRAFVKYRLTADETAQTAAAIMIETRLPTGNGDYYLSDESLGIGFRFILEHDFHFMQLAANAGLMYASNSQAQYENLSYRQRIPLSLSARVPFGPRWAMNAEASGAIPVPLNSYQNPGEGYLGLQYTDGPNLTLFGGAALGKIPGNVGSDDFRAIAGLRASFENDAKPVSPKPEPLPTMAAIAKPKPVVTFTKHRIVLGQEVRFETGRDVLTPSGKELLDEVARVIKSNTNNFKKIVIEGHTDRHGGDAYNLKLSQGRANAVRLYLISRGVDGKRLSSNGYGKRRPKITSGVSTQEMDSINRRVEFKVIQ